MASVESLLPNVPLLNVPLLNILLLNVLLLNVLLLNVPLLNVLLLNVLLLNVLLLPLLLSTSRCFLKSPIMLLFKIMITFLQQPDYSPAYGLFLHFTLPLYVFRLLYL